MDDMVMPGTLMYECCAHTLRVFIQRMGWITTKADVHYGPVPGVKSVLKCRGPVTPATRHVIYEVELKTIGYRPEPYVIADAHMFADGHRIVLFKDMSMQMNGVTRQDIESIWQEKQISDDYLDPKIFDRERLREFCRGKPSKAFGDRYTAFDRERFIARLPAPPYAFIDQVSSIEPPPWVLKPDGWIEAEFNVNPEAWYFKANRTPSLPYCAINEIALQACGWLAAYMGSALRSTQDLRFRNLGGAAVLRNDILPELTKLKTRVRLTQASEAGNMIIEHFDFTVSQEGRVVYEGKTHFGFFTADALAQQVGLRGAIFHQGAQDPSETKAIVNQPVRVTRPHTPEDQSLDPGPPAAMPAAALAMIDRIETYLPNGGPHGLGYIRGLKKVDPQAWFFEAHFYQDPVCPGSLGLESLLQLLKFDALERWGHLSARMRFGLLTDIEHDWMYRGQILPTNREITVEAVITEAGDDANPYLKADGLLHVDGLCIYKMQNFGIKMVPSDK
jgi:3-hydroxymyristoyl/3-hydroxydecanoyl-(acyl carrier protein) dehydratase